MRHAVEQAAGGFETDAVEIRVVPQECGIDDAAHAPLTSIGRNHLATGWTMSVAFDDDAVPRLLARDRHGGGLSLLAAVDAAHDPWARIGNSPLHLRRCDVDFPSWTGEAPLRRIPTGW